MNVEMFFDKFELLADVAGFIARMRMLILELAAQGRLGTQLEDDEPTLEFIESIQEHLASLRKKRELRDKPLPSLNNDELPALPATWTWVRLGNVVRYGSPEKVPSTQIPEDAWLLDLEDIEKETSRLLRRKAYAEKPSKSTKAAFQPGEVLYGKLRPYLNKVLVADEPGFCTTEFIAIQTFGFIDPEYLCYVLRRPSFVEYANSKTYGINLPRLSTQDARGAPIPLPPLAEQKRIVAKVDALMALLDDLEARQQEREHQHTTLARAALARFAAPGGSTPTNLEYLFHKSYDITPADLRKSILTLAVQGRLTGVPQDTVAPQTASLNSATDPEYPISYGVLKPGPHVPGGIPLIKSQHIRDWIVKENIEDCISEDLDAQFKRTRIKGGEVLLNLVGASIGRCAIAPASLQGANVSRAVAVITLRADIDARYFLIVLTAAFTPESIALLTSGTAQPVLNLGVVRKIDVWLPPLAEQRRIVAKVDRLMALVDELEARLTRSRQFAADLLAAVVHELTTVDTSTGSGNPTAQLESAQPIPISQ